MTEHYRPGARAAHATHTKGHTKN